MWLLVALGGVMDWLLAYAADTRTPQGVLFLARIPQRVLPERPEGSRYLILDGV